MSVDSYLDDMIRNAIIRANKAGARGVQVTDFVWPPFATSDPVLLLVTQQPAVTSADERAWYEG